MGHKGLFKPGTSGNPAGRPPKENALAEMMRKKLEEIRTLKVNGKEQKRQLKEFITEKVVDMALKGDQQSMKLLYGYVDGLPISRVQQTTTNYFPEGVTIDVDPETVTRISKELGTIFDKKGKNAKTE